MTTNISISVNEISSDDHHFPGWADTKRRLVFVLKSKSLNTRNANFRNHWNLMSRIGGVGECFKVFQSTYYNLTFTVIKVLSPKIWGFIEQC